MENACPLCRYVYGLEEPKQEPPFAVSRHFLAILKEEDNYILIFHKTHDPITMLKQIKERKKEILEDLEKCIETAIKKMSEKNGASDYLITFFYTPDDKTATQGSHGYFILIPVKTNKCEGCSGDCGCNH